MAPEDRKIASTSEWPDLATGSSTMHDGSVAGDATYDWVDDDGVSLEDTLARLGRLEPAPIVATPVPRVPRLVVRSAPVSAGGPAETRVERPFEEMTVRSGTIVL